MARGSASSLARLTGNLLQAKNDPPPIGEARENEPRQPGGAAEVDQASGRTRDEPVKLRRIEDVTPPQIGEGVAADEVDARRPPGQQLGIGLQTRACFT